VSGDRRPVIVGGGHNALVAAVLLGKAGLKPLVLERRAVAGGAAVTEEIHPGFRGPSLAHWMPPLAPALARALGLGGFGPPAPGVRLVALNPDGPPVALHDDAARTAASITPLSAADAAAWPELTASLGRIGAVVSGLLSKTPPPTDGADLRELWPLLGSARAFRALPKRDAHRLLRWLPMAVADFASEWLESDLLRAVLAARGIYGCAAGPWSAGTTANLLLSCGVDAHPAGPAPMPNGGPGAFTQALLAAARQAGAEVRTSAEVSSILVQDGRVRGVELSGGEEIAAGAVLSGVDPKRTFLSLLPPDELGPGFLDRVKNYRSSGVMAKVNLALSALPVFTGVDPSLLTARLHAGSGIDALERAFDASKYGGISEDPYLDITIPSLRDPSLAPAGAQVMSVVMQYAPYRLRDGDWGSRREELGDTVVRSLARYAPGLTGLVVGRQVLTPLDLEETYGLTGGHPFHGEHALDQLFTMRPLLGSARYRGPLQGLYLCGAGTHPGGGVTGLPGWNAAREVLKELRG